MELPPAVLTHHYEVPLPDLTIPPVTAFADMNAAEIAAVRRNLAAFYATSDPTKLDALGKLHPGLYKFLLAEGAELREKKIREEARANVNEKENRLRSLAALFVNSSKHLKVGYGSGEEGMKKYPVETLDIKQGGSELVITIHRPETGPARDCFTWKMEREVKLQRGNHIYKNTGSAKLILPNWNKTHPIQFTLAGLAARCLAKHWSSLSPTSQAVILAATCPAQRLTEKQQLLLTAAEKKAEREEEKARRAEERNKKQKRIPKKLQKKEEEEEEYVKGSPLSEIRANRLIEFKRGVKRFREEDSFSQSDAALSDDDDDDIARDPREGADENVRLVRRRLVLEILDSEEEVDGMVLSPDLLAKNDEEEFDEKAEKE